MLNRTYHPWWKWECYKAGFYSTSAPLGMEKEEALSAYGNFLRDLKAFNLGIDRVMREWPNSCEHFLTNSSINRVAWLGQSAMCITRGVPSIFKGGFNLLSEEDKMAANNLAKHRLNLWLENRDGHLKKSA